jgi:pimeloyl-ACP methyl ester carboxylesterase
MRAQKGSVMRVDIKPFAIAVALAATVTGFANASPSLRNEMKQASQGKYANVNGLKMYYEIHGTGQPLVLLHGSFGTVEGWGKVLPTLAKTRQVIVVELQGHGRTADIDRPITYPQLAEDTAALLKELKIKNADVFGYSMGGGIAFHLAAKHPELVRRLAVLGAGTGTVRDTYDPEIYKQYKSIDPDNFDFPMVKDPYIKVAPDPSKWNQLVAKVLKMDDLDEGLATKDAKGIKAPTLILVGDRDAVRVEHAVEVYRTIPNARLAIFPGADHFVLFTSMDKVLGTLTAFLDGPAEVKVLEGLP